MNKLSICIGFLFLLIADPCPAQSTGKSDYKKNSVQIGKTGYYFDRENPFGFGRVLVYNIPVHQQTLFYWPYIGYIRKITPRFGIGVSIEQYASCYVCDTLDPWPPVLFEIETRSFKHLQVNLLYEYPVDEKWRLILRGGMGYRWELYGQFWTTGYLDHGFWRETFGYGKSFYEWGAGGAAEIKYKFYKDFSLSLKGEYFSFPKRPVRHWGAGAYIGYDF